MHTILLNSLFTELIVKQVGAVILIGVSCTCDVICELCIAPEESNADCYVDVFGIENYNFTVYNNKPYLQTTVMLAMNNTVYTLSCPLQLCGIGSTSSVCATSKLIVAGK